MIDRILQEEREFKFLSPLAAKSKESLGRAKEESKCELRTDFQRDRDRIIHSKAFRRLKHKTQVFLSPEGDHFRTRLTHTIEVSQVSRTIARGLCLNEDLTEAIALGHDLGHTPFGHNGEIILDSIYSNGFKHNIQSLRVVEVLEGNKGPQNKGLNLTKEVRDGILNHTGPNLPITLEGQIVKISDRIAYINHDIDDAIRSGIITHKDLPKGCIEILGNTCRERINTLVLDMIKNSDGKSKIIQSDRCKDAMNKLRQYMFKNVYLNSKVKSNYDLDNVEKIITELYNFYLDNSDLMPLEFRSMIDDWGLETMVKDHVAGMTDRFAISQYQKYILGSNGNCNNMNWFCKY